MKSLLILNKIKVENANAISGMVYGFPAVTHFLGYVHALSREVKEQLGLELGGCGIICHDFQVRTYKIKGWGEHVFSLARKPLDKDGKTPSFNEEGKVHMEVSLIVECDFTGNNFNFGTEDINLDIQKFEKFVYEKAVNKRLAGGIITNISSINFTQIPQSEDEVQPFFKKIFRKMLPGFLLQDKKDIFKKYLDDNPDLNSFDAFLDFYALKFEAKDPKKDSVNKNIEWRILPKPSKGWFVPLQVGYKAISSLYEKNEVASVRNKNIPFRFVEPIYGLGEWMGLHRIKDPEIIFWRYQYDQNKYICLNK